jgi:hypothetical protein
LEDLLTHADSGPYNEWQQCRLHLRISCFCHDDITDCGKLKEYYGGVASNALQIRDLLDHTISRTVQAHEILLASVAGKIIQKIALAPKCGSDGSTEHGQHKQTFSGE